MKSERTIQDIDDEIEFLREDGPDGLDARAREDWNQAIRELEEEKMDLRRSMDQKMTT